MASYRRRFAATCALVVAIHVVLLGVFGGIAIAHPVDEHRVAAPVPHDSGDGLHRVQLIDLSPPEVRSIHDAPPKVATFDGTPISVWLPERQLEEPSERAVRLVGRAPDPALRGRAPPR